MKFQPTPTQLFFTKNDPEDRRLGEFALAASSLQDLALVKPQFAIWGYPDDEGIRMNGGRPGATLAPDTIRKFLYRMTPAENFQGRILDFGNVSLQTNLNDRHEQGRNLCHEVSKAQVPFIAFGGGHDYGYCETTGFLSHFVGNKKKPLVINIDAHLDVRDTQHGNHSGTPFRRSLNEFKTAFEFFEVGLQPQCNSPDHAAWARQQGAQLFWLGGPKGAANSNELIKNLKSKLAPFKGHPVFLSVDIDGFSSSIAPGCSQSWPTGLELNSFLNLLYELKTNFHLCGLGLYEVSPPLDFGDLTSKLAALIAYHFMFPFHPPLDMGKDL